MTILKILHLYVRTPTNKKMKAAALTAAALILDSLAASFNPFLAILTASFAA